MTTVQLSVAIFLFGTTFWLGLYLLVRAPYEWYARLGGLAHLVFAVGVVFVILDHYAPAIETALRYNRYGFAAIILASILLLASLFLLAPSFHLWQKRLAEQPTHLALAWVGMILYAICIAFLLLFRSDSARFVSVSVAALALLMVGLAFVIIYAFDEGESWAPHLFRSFDYTLFTAVLFGGQVVVLMMVVFDVSYPFLLLLMGMIATAVLIQVFSDPVQTLMDKVAFAMFPKIRRTRNRLRAESEAAQLVDPSLNLMTLDADKFAKHTRKALSHMGDLPKLAANPLNYLPIVDARLNGTGEPVDSTLLRAMELKIVLTESIERLKPPSDKPFGTTDAWRHYNALYFPYVLGIRPYSRRYYSESHKTDPTTQEALNWFRTQVPERTLYNWQNAAAKLIARDLRERSR